MVVGSVPGIGCRAGRLRIPLDRGRAGFIARGACGSCPVTALSKPPAHLLSRAPGPVSQTRRPKAPPGGPPGDFPQAGRAAAEAVRPGGPGRCTAEPGACKALRRVKVRPPGRTGTGGTGRPSGFRTGPTGRAWGPYGRARRHPGPGPTASGRAPDRADRAGLGPVRESAPPPGPGAHCVRPGSGPGRPGGLRTRPTGQALGPVQECTPLPRTEPGKPTPSRRTPDRADRAGARPGDSARPPTTSSSPTALSLMPPRPPCSTPSRERRSGSGPGHGRTREHPAPRRGTASRRTPDRADPRGTRARTRGAPYPPARPRMGTASGRAPDRAGPSGRPGRPGSALPAAGRPMAAPLATARRSRRAGPWNPAAPRGRRKAAPAGGYSAAPSAAPKP